jgi:branched-chain amino acid transport system permease protein
VTPDVLAVSFDVFGQSDFWIGVGVLAGVYGIFTLGLQLNVGFTGISNFGQAGFMAIGAYGMGVLVVEAEWAFFPAMLGAMVIAMAAGLIIGLPTLRLRADYFAIVTLAFAEIIRITAQNAREITGGNQGLRQFDLAWIDWANPLAEDLADYGLESGRPDQIVLLIVTWIVFAILIVALTRLQRTPWGRVLRAVREDEDAARALGKNPFVYKLQSLAIAAAIGAIAGYLLALQLVTLFPDSFQPLVTFIGYAVLVLGGLASYLGVAIGAVIIWVLLEGTRLVDLPLSDDKIAALRFMIIGVVLIGVMVFRPQGILGKRQEMQLGE